MVSGESSSRLGKRIRELRLAAQLSQRGLAERAHISPSYVSKLETGARPNVSVDIIRSIARALNYPLETLLREAGILPPPSGDEGKDQLILEALEIADVLPRSVLETEMQRLRILAEHYRRESLKSGSGSSR